MTKTIICLANSKKNSGRCIAGKTQDGKIWIRPISLRNTHEISEDERQYKDGSMPKIYDIITITLKEHSPSSFQTENHTIDDSYYWEKIGKLSFLDLCDYIDNPQSLWNNHNSSYQGINDRISVENIISINNSLYFICVKNSHIIVREEGAEFRNPKIKVRISFSYNNIDYLIPVTDPQIVSLYLKKGIGTYEITKNHYLTISLGLPYDNYCYILCAAVFYE